MVRSEAVRSGSIARSCGRSGLVVRGSHGPGGAARDGARDSRGRHPGAARPGRPRRHPAGSPAAAPAASTGPARAGADLARRAGIAKQSMAELVAELERLDYVERQPDPRDGRARARASDGSWADARGAGTTRCGRGRGGARPTSRPRPVRRAPPNVGRGGRADEYRGRRPVVWCRKPRRTEQRSLSLVPDRPWGRDRPGQPVEAHSAGVIWARRGSRGRWRSPSSRGCG